MVENKLPLAEGASIRRPPMLSGINYQFWKIRMKIFIESIDQGIWDAIINGLYTPKHIVENVQVDKPWNQWTEEERMRVQYDCNAKNILTSSLNMDEFFRVSQCKSVKEMWEVLEVTHEGTNDVKRVRKHALIQEYELFKMKQRESIVDVQKKFTHTVNHLMGLGKEFDKEELNIKVLKCLGRSWQQKVTVISETRDLSPLSTAALFGKLREHEIEMQRLNELESSERKVKNIALKTSTKKNEEPEDEVAESSESENLNLIVKRFVKYLKRKGIKGNTKRYTSKHNESNSSNFTYYNCGKQGHIKIKCPNANKEKEKSVDTKKEKKPKEKPAYIASEDNDDSTTSSSSQDESEEANLCLMVGYESSFLSQVSSLDINNYNQLLHDFEELHSEANKISALNNRLKGLNNWLKNRVSQLEKVTANLRTDFKHLEMIYNNSIDCFRNQLAEKPCENCTVLKNQVKYLIKTYARFTRGEANLEAILGS